MDVWDELDRLIEESERRGFSVGVKIEVASECCWSCEIRVTPRPHADGGPDRSTVWYSVGGDCAEMVVGQCLDAIKKDRPMWEREVAPVSTNVGM